MYRIRFGSNIFASDQDFTLIGADQSGNLIVGGFGASPPERIVWISFRGGSAFLNADIADADGEMVLQIRDNVITLNKDNIYEVQQIPESQIPPDRVAVTNRYGETALDLRREGDLWDFNGDFYHRSYHIIATPEGTVINPRVPSV